MPSLSAMEGAAGRASHPFPQRTRPPCYLMRSCLVTGRQDCSQDSSREQEINPPARDRGGGGSWAGQVIKGPCNYCAFNLGQSSQEGDGDAAQSEAPADSGKGYQPCLALFLPFPLLSPLGPIYLCSTTSDSLILIFAQLFLPLPKGLSTHSILPFHRPLLRLLSKKSSWTNPVGGLLSELT